MIISRSFKIILRTILLHDLYLWNDPELLDSFITQGVMLGGSHGFPPLLQQLLTFSPSFVRRFNELRNDSNEFLFFNAPKVCECIKRLFKKDPSMFSSKVWTLNKGDFSPVLGISHFQLFFHGSKICWEHCLIFNTIQRCHSRVSKSLVKIFLTGKSCKFVQT